jgi:hypothetical protein
MGRSEAASRLQETLVSMAGGYLRNPIRKPGVTCVDCMTPVNGFELCYTCKSHRGNAGLGDFTAFLTYAIAGRESGYVMRGYKARPPLAEHRMVVGLMLILALHEHSACLERMAGSPITHWAVVPSLPAKSTTHQLRSLVAGHAPGAEVMLSAAIKVPSPRAVMPQHYSCPVPLTRESHVLLVDDTWASGGHAQSAALALRGAGAGTVSVLVVARWINEDFASNREFLTRLAGRDFDPASAPGPPGSARELSALQHPGAVTIPSFPHTTTIPGTHP